MDNSTAECIKCGGIIHSVLSGETHYPFCDSCFNFINRAERRRLIEEWRSKEANDGTG